MYMYVYTHAYASKQVLSACYARSSVLIMTGDADKATNTSFNIYSSTGFSLVIHRPNHGPGVDVEQGAARARIALTVVHIHT